MLAIWGWKNSRPRQIISLTGNNAAGKYFATSAIQTWPPCAALRDRTVTPRVCTLLPSCTAGIPAKADAGLVWSREPGDNVIDLT